jgi:hypothetical protein
MKTNQTSSQWPAAKTMMLNPMDAQCNDAPTEEAAIQEANQDLGNLAQMMTAKAEPAKIFQEGVEVYRKANIDNLKEGESLQIYSIFNKHYDLSDITKWELAWNPSNAPGIYGTKTYYIVEKEEDLILKSDWDEKLRLKKETEQKKRDLKHKKPQIY